MNNYRLVRVPIDLLTLTQLLEEIFPDMFPAEGYDFLARRSGLLCIFHGRIRNTLCFKCYYPTKQWMITHLCGGGLCFELDGDQFYETKLASVAVPPASVAVPPVLVPLPWWERHYTLETEVSIPACTGAVPAPEEIRGGMDFAPVTMKGVPTALWHEKAANQERARREEVLALRRFIRKDITGMMTE